MQYRHQKHQWEKKGLEKNFVVYGNKRATRINKPSPKSWRFRPGKTRRVSWPEENVHLPPTRSWLHPTRRVQKKRATSHTANSASTGTEATSRTGKPRCDGVLIGRQYDGECFLRGHLSMGGKLPGVTVEHVSGRGQVRD